MVDAVRVSVAVQHHPSRSELLPDLLARLEGIDVEIVEDPEPDARPSPWRCYEECLRRTPDWPSHRLIIQDDAVPCEGFATAAVKALEAQPERPVAFWVGGMPADACAAIRRASNRREAWSDLSPWTWFPCVASAWPAPVVERFLKWLETTRHRVTAADDAVTARFLQSERIWPLATVPSLVEHPDVVASVIGRRAWAGRDRGRVACIGIGDRDASKIVW